MDPTGWLFYPLFPGRIGIWKCWFLRREENRSTQRKTLGGRTRANNKLNPLMTPSPGIKPGPHWWEASALTTAPSLLPYLNNYSEARQVQPYFFCVRSIRYSKRDETVTTLFLLLCCQKVFCDIRDRHFSNVFGYLSQKAKEVQSGYDVSTGDHLSEHILT